MADAEEVNNLDTQLPPAKKPKTLNKKERESVTIDIFTTVRSIYYLWCDT